MKTCKNTGCFKAVPYKRAVYCEKCWPQVPEHIKDQLRSTYSRS